MDVISLDNSDCVRGRTDCQWIKSKLSEFISETLKMELSEEKTLITHSSECARFLGYDVRVRRNAVIKHGGPGNKTKRTLNNSCELAIPLQNGVKRWLYAKNATLQYTTSEQLLTER